MLTNVRKPGVDHNIATHAGMNFFFVLILSIPVHSLSVGFSSPKSPYIFLIYIFVTALVLANAIAAWACGIKYVK